MLLGMRKALFRMRLLGSLPLLLLQRPYVLNCSYAIVTKKGSMVFRRSYLAGMSNIPIDQTALHQIQGFAIKHCN